MRRYFQASVTVSYDALAIEAEAVNALPIFTGFVKSLSILPCTCKLTAWFNPFL